MCETGRTKAAAAATYSEKATSLPKSVLLLNKFYGYISWQIMCI